MPSKQALEHVTSGTYQRELESLQAQSWTADTEVELPELATDIVASGQDEMFSWIRGHYMLWDTASALALEYAVIRCKSTDALQDLNDGSTMEALQKEGRIFKTGLLAVQIYTRIIEIKFEFKQVKLPDGEELRLVIRPLRTTSNSTEIVAKVEWRKIGA